MVAQGPAQDSLRAVLDSVFAGKDYRWAVRPPPLAMLRHWLDELQKWWVALSESDPVAFRIIGWGLLVLLVALVVHAAWLAARTPRDEHDSTGTPSPAHTRRDEGWYRAEADRLAAIGRYPEAMQADFLALILALDAQHLVRFHPSTTPAEYPADEQLPPPARAELRALVGTLYGYVFARWPCSAEDFADWRGRARPERYASTH